MLPSRFAAGMLCAGLMALVADAALSQDYPNKPIRIFTGSVGGGSDFAARQIAQGISGPLGQQVIVENRGGWLIQGDTVSKAPPDGYTLLAAGPSLWIGPLLQKAPYDTVRDFSPISLLGREVLVLAVHPSVPVKSVKELIALAKARPGELNYGSTLGGTSYLAVQLFKSMAGIDIVWIPYKGSGPTMAALVSGEIQLTITDASLVAPHAKSGRLKALAVSSAEPSALTPGLPTMAATVPGYQSVGQIAVFAPGKTPASIISRLNPEIVRFVNRTEVKEQFLGAGVEIIGSSPEQLAATIKSEITKWGKVIKDAGIKLD